MEEAGVRLGFQISYMYSMSSLNSKPSLRVYLAAVAYAEEQFTQQTNK